VVAAAGDTTQHKRFNETAECVSLTALPDFDMILRDDYGYPYAWRHIRKAYRSGGTVQHILYLGNRQ